MTTDPAFAQSFIADYTALLAEAHRLAGGPPSPSRLEALSFGREALQRDPAILPGALAALGSRRASPPPAFRQALATLRVRDWVYLKDTASHSVFLDAERDEALGVVGLTSPVQHLLGGACLLFRAGVFEHEGAFVCDGILEDPLVLSMQQRRAFSARLAGLATRGRVRLATESWPSEAGMHTG